MQTVTIGKKQGLVFPVMCNGVIKIDYSDNIPDIESDTLTSTDMPYGIWGHTGSFSFDAMITPYDVNGGGKLTTGGSSLSILDSKKTFPYDGYFSERNLESSGTAANSIRATHEMAIFYSTKLQIYLVNNTTNNLDSPNYITHNHNNPASYKIKVVLITGSTTTTLTSNVVIHPSISQPFTWASSHGLAVNNQGRVEQTSIETLGGSAHGGSTTFTSGTSPASNLYFIGQKLFTQSGFDFISIGTVSGVSGTTVTLDGTPSSSLNSQIIYQEALKEATYVDNLYHVGVSYDNSTQKLSILFNGSPAKTTTHNDENDFQLDAEDLYLGANGSNTFASSSGLPSNFGVTNKQFYGVFHEMSFSKGLISSYDSGSLQPIYKDLLMFLNFEEVDL